MKIQYQKIFEKHFKKLPLKLQKKIITAIGKFAQNPFDPTLKNHALSGKLSGKRVFSVTGDVRIVFEEFDDYIVVLMLDAGTHNQVYP